MRSKQRVKLALKKRNVQKAARDTYITPNKADPRACSERHYIQTIVGRARGRIIPTRAHAPDKYRQAILESVSTEPRLLFSRRTEEARTDDRPISRAALRPGCPYLLVRIFREAAARQRSARAGIRNNTGGCAHSLLRAQLRTDARARARENDN